MKSVTDEFFQSIFVCLHSRDAENMLEVVPLYTYLRPHYLFDKIRKKRRQRQQEFPHLAKQSDSQQCAKDTAPLSHLRRAISDTSHLRRGDLRYELQLLRIHMHLFLQIDLAHLIKSTSIDLVLSMAG